MDIFFSELFPVSKCKWRKCRSSAFHCSTGKFHQNRFTGSEDRRCNILHRYNGPVTAVERWKMYESFGNQLQTARVEGVIVGRGAKNRVRRTNLKVLENLSTDLIKVSSKSNPRTICATKKKTVKNSNISQIAPLPATSSQRSVWNYKFSGLVFTFLRLVTAKWDHWPTDKAKGTEAYPLLFYIGKSLETFLWKPWTGPVGYVSILYEILLQLKVCCLKMPLVTSASILQLSPCCCCLAWAVLCCESGMWAVLVAVLSTERAVHGIGSVMEGIRGFTY